MNPGIMTTGARCASCCLGTFLGPSGADAGPNVKLEASWCGADVPAASVWLLVVLLVALLVDVDEGVDSVLRYTEGKAAGMAAGGRN